MNLFLVKSPLQLLNAIEAKNHFKTSKSVLVISYDQIKNNDKQIDLLVDEAYWDKVHRVGGAGIKRTVRHFKLIKHFQSQGLHFDKLFIGDLRMYNFLAYSANLQHESLYLLDDGSVTIHMQQDYIAEGEVPLPGLIPLLIKNTLLILLGLRPYKYVTINLFTIFELSAIGEQSIIKNEFSYLLDESNVELQDRDLGIIIGAKFVELGYYELAEYMKLIEFVIATKETKEWCYIPHRGESITTLEAISTINNVKVEQLDQPVEIYMLSNNYLPKYVIGFVSTALFIL
ncbi:MAG: hypothetical protein RJQ14_21535, partial [Marinoscillum sp.]